MRFAAFAMGLVLAWGPAWAASGVAPSAGTLCPAYGAHLTRARAYLACGQRAGALDELRRARMALAACLREGAGGAPFLARLPAASPTA